MGQDSLSWTMRRHPPPDLACRAAMGRSTHAGNIPQETMQGTSISTASDPPQALCMHTSKTRAGSLHSLMEGQTAQMLKVTISHRMIAAGSGKQGKSSLPNLSTKQPCTGSPNKAVTKQTHAQTPFNTWHFQHFKALNTQNKQNLRPFIRIFHVSPPLLVFACRPGLSNAREAEES